MKRVLARLARQMAAKDPRQGQKAVKRAILALTPKQRARLYAVTKERNWS